MNNVTCTLDGCGRKFLARGLCAGHYRRWSIDGESFDQSQLQPRIPKGTPCSVEGCTRSMYSKGLCNPHWQRQYSKGVIGDKPIARRSKQGQTLQQRFDVHAQAAPTDRGCIEWDGPLTEQGYGRVRFGSRSQYASRVSWELSFGAIPPEIVVRHKCDNPPCVNIQHLELGTQADNIGDMVARDRDLRGERSPRAKLTESEVLEMRALAASGTTQRELSQQFGISRGHVGAIVQRLFWKHI